MNDSNENLPQTQDVEVLPISFDNAMFMNGSAFNQIVKVAGMFSRSKLVPAHFQGQGESCFIALQMALRLKVDPFMLMQNMYVVHGKPGFEAKFVIALINSSGIYEDPLDFDFDDENNPTWCVAYAIRKSTKKRQQTKVTIEMAKQEGWWGKSGSKWPTMTAQMLTYRAASFFARRYCPELIMGLQTVDEIRDVGPTADREPLTSGNAEDLAKLLSEPEKTGVTEHVDTETGEVTQVTADPEVQPKQEAKPEQPAPKQQGLSGLSRIKQHSAKQ